jgi:hypothetical protein
MGAAVSYVSLSCVNALTIEEDKADRAKGRFALVPPPFPLDGVFS